MYVCLYVFARARICMRVRVRVRVYVCVCVCACMNAEMYVQRRHIFMYAIYLMFNVVYDMISFNIARKSGKIH